MLGAILRLKNRWRYLKAANWLEIVMWSMTANFLQDISARSVDFIKTYNSNCLDYAIF